VETHNLRVPSLEVVDADIVLDDIKLLEEGELRLEQEAKLLLRKPGEVIDDIEVKVDDCERGLLDDLVDDEGPLLDATLLYCWRGIALNVGWDCSR
jgi:hypothetical protein